MGEADTGGGWGSDVEAGLTPRFEHDHGDRIRQIQAAVAWSHRQTYALFIGELIEHGVRQAARFGAEHEPVAGLEHMLVKAARAARG